MHGIKIHYLVVAFALSLTFLLAWYFFPFFFLPFFLPFTSILFPFFLLPIFLSLFYSLVLISLVKFKCDENGNKNVAYHML